MNPLPVRVLKAHPIPDTSAQTCSPSWLGSNPSGRLTPLERTPTGEEEGATGEGAEDVGMSSAMAVASTMTSGRAGGRPAMDSTDVSGSGWP